MRIDFLPADHPLSPPEAHTDQAPRFEFGRNWRDFLRFVDERRIGKAEESLRHWLGRNDLTGVRFLDAGAGSGLFSLAARRLGARVHSFDVDPQSVACTEELRRRYATGDPEWTIDRGSVLDTTYLSTLGTFDVVYSWGVLHHTGRLWESIANIARLVREGGQLYIAIYNDQGRRSRSWWYVKRAYQALPRPLRLPYVLAVGLTRELGAGVVHLLTFQPGRYLRSRIHYRENRGMSWWHDTIDWIGGFPFEVAKPEDVFDYLRRRHFTLTRMKTCGGRLGCNEFIFVRDQDV